MASLISHAVLALGVGTAFYERRYVSRWLVAGACCSMIPDVDVIGFQLGVPYGAFCGHRGFTHSLFFASLLATLVVFLFFRYCDSFKQRALVWLFLFLVTASHGVLDAMTNGGLGVALFSPFDTTRYFFPWRPILVSPIGIGRFLSDRGVAVLRSELLCIWLPTLVFVALTFAAKLFSRTHQTTAD